MHHQRPIEESLHVLARALVRERDHRHHVIALVPDLETDVISDVIARVQDQRTEGKIYSSSSAFYFQRMKRHLQRVFSSTRVYYFKTSV